MSSIQPPSKYSELKNKWTAKHSDLQQKIIKKHARPLKRVVEKVDVRKVAAGSLGGLVMLLNPGTSMLPSPHHLIEAKEALPKNDEDRQRNFVRALQSVLPPQMQKLEKFEEEELEEILSSTYGMNVRAELEGKKLNRSYGMIGGEQHLYRYPGDTLEQHAEESGDAAMYLPSGIAPGLGAWGYFTPSQAEFTNEDMMRERYYLAVQTFLADGYNQRVNEYRDFFQFRKMLVVNPETGQAVVAVIGDAGPAEWTGKHLGGSPEVMHFVGLAEGPRKGAVLYFFIDDPDNKVPLGPVNIGGK
jgi:hypothetical protein